MNTSIPQNQHALSLALTQPLGAQIPLQQLETLRQKCKKCRETFSEGSEERNYNNFATYGFRTRAAFEKHSARNGRCPCKQAAEGAGGGAAPIQAPLPPARWPAYASSSSTRTDGDYVEDQAIAQSKLNKHDQRVVNGTSNPLWFDTSEEAANQIVEKALDSNTLYISLVAQPGSGKTMVIHSVIRKFTLGLPHNEAIHPDHITVTTGMSCTAWRKQTLKNLTLRDRTMKDFLWTSLNSLSDNHCLVHRANLRHRVTYLLDHLELLSDHVFIIDESHYADGVNMTIAKQLFKDELGSIGLTEERMKSHNIKFIFVSATPDVTLSSLRRNQHHHLVHLKEGEGYKGFNHYMEQDMIMDYDSVLKNIELLKPFIQSRWPNRTDPRYHYIRVRQSNKNSDREHIESLKEIGWDVTYIDSGRGINNVIVNSESEEQDTNPDDNPIRTYLRPPRHTILLLSDKFRASKRLVLTPYIGLVAEKPAQQQNTTVTCQGLVPRFFGYPEEQSFLNDQLPVFLCNIKCVKEYIEFVRTWTYSGKSYIGNGIKSTITRTRECKETCYGVMGGMSPTTMNHVPGTKQITKMDLGPVDVYALERTVQSSPQRTSIMKGIVERVDPDLYNEFRNYDWQLWTLTTGDEHYNMPVAGGTTTSSNVCRRVAVGELRMEGLDIIRVTYDSIPGHPRAFGLAPWNGTSTPDAGTRRLS
jgi:hypothetical protein